MLCLLVGVITDVVEMMQRLFPKQTKKSKARKALEDLKGAGKKEGLHTHHTLDEIKEALGLMPPRTLAWELTRKTAWLCAPGPPWKRSNYRGAMQ